MDLLSKCELCPQNCKINRHKTVGFCRANDKIKIARADLYNYEEPCISNHKGSGAIFFSNCNLKCLYCQNRDISHEGFGAEIDTKRLVEIYFELKELGANNINLVTPTHYLPMIITSLKVAKEKGLNLPIVYNTSGYEKKETIKLLDGLIDIYLPDFKYYNDDYAIKYSNAKNYSKYAKEALQEMVRQTGPCQFKDGLIIKGTIVRHLMLPNLINDTKNIIKYLYTTYHNSIYLSIMNQYTPLSFIKEKELNKKINKSDYEEVILYAYDLGVRNCYCQEDGTAKESFIPLFDLKGVKKESN